MKDPAKINAQTWNKLASRYEEKFMDMELYHDSYNAFLKLLEKDQVKILELGCGPGMICKYLLKKNPKLQILATDMADNMLLLAQKNNPSAHFQIMDCRDLGNLDSTFDAIIAGFVIPYLTFEDVAKLVKDSLSVLHSYGLIYLSFIEGTHQNSGLEKGSSGDSIYVYYYEDETIAKLFVDSQFQIVNSFKKEFVKINGQKESHSILIAQKVQ